MKGNEEQKEAGGLAGGSNECEDTEIKGGLRGWHWLRRARSQSMGEREEWKRDKRRRRRIRRRRRRKRRSGREARREGGIRKEGRKES